MADIVERLMNRHCCQDNLDQEAAQEIERLRGEKTELLKALTDLFDVCKWEKISPEVYRANYIIYKHKG